MSWIDLNGIVHVISNDNEHHVYTPLCDGPLAQYGAEGGRYTKMRDGLMESLKIARKANEQQMPTCIACMALFTGYT